MSEKKFNSKDLLNKINAWLTKAGCKIKNFFKKILKCLGHAGTFLLAVALVFWDKLKALYGKIPDKFKIFSKIGGKESRTNTNGPKNKKSIFSGFSEKDYAKLWAICGVFCALLFATVIIILVISKPKVPKPVEISQNSSVYSSSWTASVSFGGSIIMQDSLLNSCKTEMGDYEIYDGIKYLSKCFTSDLNIVSVIGAVNETSVPVSGYPKTNYPVNLIRALKSIHVNGIALASDHSFDAGVAGIDSTIAACKEQDVTPFGLFSDGNDYINPQICEINGIKIGFLNASCVTDDDYSALSEEERQNRVRYVNGADAKAASDAILQDVQVLKNSGANFIVVMLRWGTADFTTPSDVNRDIADTLVKNGVDVILGYGSNYLQKVTFKEFEQTDGTKKNCLIMYDLGNFYSDNSAASEKYAIPQDNLLVTLQLSMEENGTQAVISKAGYTPLYTSKKADNDISDRSMFINIPSGVYGSADEKPDIFSTNEQWTWCKNSFERTQSKMAEWVGQRMVLNETVDQTF